MMRSVIAIEGPDRFGKTLLARLLSQELGYTYIKFPNENIESGKELRRIINGDVLHDPSKIMNWVSSYQNLQNRNKLETLEGLPGGKYIFDRYKLSEIVYGKASGISCEKVEELADNLPDPDITILITGRPYGRDRDIFSTDEYQQRVKHLYKIEGKNLSGRVIWLCNYSSPENMLDNVLSELKGVV